MPLVDIQDLSDPRLLPYTRLTAPARWRHAEQRAGFFVAESPKVIRVALARGYEPLSLLMERRQLALQGGEIANACGDVPVFTADRAVLESLTGYSLTRGILCAMRRPAPQSAEAICAQATRIAVLENLVDATNVGALFRSAAALNVDAVLLSPSCCDPLCRRAVRVSMGAVLTVPWAYCGEKPDDWPQNGLERLHRMGFATAALALSESSLPIDHPTPAGEAKLALILGTEGDGLSPATLAGCDYTLKIPMTRGVDSLNVAAAGAIAFWQLAAPKHRKTSASKNG